jgi:error-prone DNA polymerase
MAETAGKLAWVKRYYPLEFYCSWLNEWPFGFYSPGVIVNEARRNGIEVLGVDANASRGECAIEDRPNGTQAVRLGFNFVKGIGEALRKRLDDEAARFCHSERSEESGPPRTSAGLLEGPDPSLTLRVTDPLDEQAPWGVQRGSTPLPGDVPPTPTTSLGGRVGTINPAYPHAPQGPRYVSLWDFWRRTKLPREPIEHLIRLGAFAWTGLHERELLWQLGLFYQPLNRQLPLALPFEADLVSLPEMSGAERVHADLVLTEGAIATRGHIMDLAFPSTGPGQALHEGITPSHLVDRLEHGAKVTVAGFVAVRQAPGTAKGFVFHTLEDRYGLVNIITTPNLVRRYKELVAGAGALIVHGHIERQERAVNVITERMEPLPLGGAVPPARTHTFG